MLKRSYFSSVKLEGSSVTCNELIRLTIHGRRYQDRLQTYGQGAGLPEHVSRMHVPIRQASTLGHLSLRPPALHLVYYCRE